MIEEEEIGDTRIMSEKGGTILSSCDHRIGITLPQGCVLKPLRMGLKVLDIPSDICRDVLGDAARASAILTILPWRRKFHKAVKIVMPSPTDANHPELKLLCSIGIVGSNTGLNLNMYFAGPVTASIATGSSMKWDDITSTKFTDTDKDGNVVFTSTVSAHFWLFATGTNTSTEKVQEMTDQLFHRIIELNSFVTEPQPVGSFLQAAKVGDLSSVLCHLEEEKLSADTQSSNGWSALHLAVKEGYADMTTELLLRGACVNIQTKKGNTPLHIACDVGRPDIVNVLLHHGADVNQVSSLGHAALGLTVSAGSSLEVVKLLLQNGADPDQIGAKDGMTPLMTTVQDNNIGYFDVLFEVCDIANTPLPPDFRQKYKSTAEYIIDNADGEIASVVARQMLKASGEDFQQDIDSVDEEKSPRIQSFLKSAHIGDVAMITQCIKDGLDINSTTKRSMTGLHFACLAGQKKMVELFLKNHADVNIMSQGGFTPLFMAAHEGHADIVTTLLQAGANCALSDKNGLSPRIVAKTRGNNAVTKAFQEHIQPPPSPEPSPKKTVKEKHKRSSCAPS